MQFLNGQETPIWKPPQAMEIRLEGHLVPFTNSPSMGLRFLTRVSIMENGLDAIGATALATLPFRGAFFWHIGDAKRLV